MVPPSSRREAVAAIWLGLMFNSSETAEIWLVFIGPHRLAAENAKDFRVQNRPRKQWALLCTKGFAATSYFPLTIRIAVGFAVKSFSRHNTITSSMGITEANAHGVPGYTLSFEPWENE